ncbi:hypothetical protein CUMW_190000 [Citrus unshiu]|nr:hypothetical protein CUMW_190000 [Citrus unshiu]
MAGAVKRIKLGSQGLRGFSARLRIHGHVRLLRAPKPESDMIALIHHAIDSGITLLDTSDSYGPHTNEILLGKSIYKFSIILVITYAVMGDANKWAFARGASEAGAALDLAFLVENYYYSNILLISNIKQMRCCKVMPCGTVGSTAPSTFILFQPENLEHNKKLFERVNELAVKKGCTPSQLALAWVHHQGDDVCLIPGTTKIENLNQNIKALSVKLTPEEIAELKSIASADAVRGHRYGGVTPTYEDSTVFMETFIKGIGSLPS